MYYLCGFFNDIDIYDRNDNMDFTKRYRSMRDSNAGIRINEPLTIKISIEQIYNLFTVSCSFKR